MVPQSVSMDKMLPCLTYCTFPSPAWGYPTHQRSQLCAAYYWHSTVLDAEVVAQLFPVVLFLSSHYVKNPTTVVFM